MKILIDKNKLEELFIVRNLSRKDCANILDISESSVKRLCKLYNLHKSKEATNNSRKQTNLKKYGVSSYSQTKEYQEKYRNTNLERYGVDNYAKTSQCKIKAKQTCFRKYGGPSPMSSSQITEKVKIGVKKALATGIPQTKAKQTNLKKYGVESPFQSKIVRQKIKDTLIERYGVEYPMQSEKAKDKQYETKKRNNSFNTSKPEEQAYQLLLTKFDKEDIIRQYKSELYPFKCDFYIKSLDLYIECQFSQYHGKHPFNENSEEDKQRLAKYKYKYFANPKSTYKAIISVWTKRDPLKRETAKKNHLNWVEFWSVKEVKDWLEIY